MRAAFSRRFALRSAVRSAPLLACSLVAVTAAGCTDDSAEDKIVVYGGTAADHGAALFRDPSLAKTSFNAYSCSTCHEARAGDAGDAILVGAALAGSVKRASYWGGAELDLLQAINNCLYYFMLKDTPWKADDAEARAMYAYLESLPAEWATSAPVPFTPVYVVSEPPAGDAARGARIYARACKSCHGEVSTGASRLVERASVLPDQVLAEHPTSNYTDLERRLVFVEKTRHGGFIGYGGQMPPFSIEKLSDKDLGDLLTFFKLP